MRRGCAAPVPGGAAARRGLPSVDVPRSARLLAEVLERQGKADEARRLVEGFLRDWRDADPDLLDLTRARALCERLHCQPAPKPTVTP